MIYQDSNGYPTQNTGDQGDGSMRAGMGTLTNLLFPRPVSIASYEVVWGWMARSPVQKPWNNALNCTRDQLIPYLAGLNQTGFHGAIRRLGVWHMLRLGFCQDFQRDAPGTWKMPFPATYVNNQGVQVTKVFDFADPLLPNHWWCFIRGGHLYPLYVLYPLCLIFALLSIYSSIGAGKEQNQVIAEMSFHPPWMMRLYCKWNPGWVANNMNYWMSRGETEYATAIGQYVVQRCAQ